MSKGTTKAITKVTTKTAARAKRYEELEFTDDFMFCKILQNNPDLCKELTELIIGRKIGGIIQTEQQKSIEITADGKGVRFDVYLEDDENTVYDIEMQTVMMKNLPKRSRYYQAMIDLNMIERGSDYSDLKKSYIIFICLENPYADIGLHKYTFETICREFPNLTMGDDAIKVFLSAEGTADDISDEMKAFLQFLTKKQADSALTQKLQKEVQKAREQKRWRQEYMTLYEKLKDEREAGREEGIKQGIERGELSHLVRVVCKKLQKNMSAAEIADILEEDENMIELIGDAAAGYAPDYDVEAIVEHLLQGTEKEDIVAH